MAKENGTVKRNSLVESNMKPNINGVEKVKRIIDQARNIREVLERAQKGQSFDDDPNVYALKNLLFKKLGERTWAEDELKALPLREILSLLGSDRYAKLKLPEVPHEEIELKNPEAPESSLDVAIKNSQRSTLAPISKNKSVITAQTLERIIGPETIGKMKDYNVDIHDPDYETKNALAYKDFVNDTGLFDTVSAYADKAAQAAADNRKRPFADEKEKQAWITEKSADAQVKLFAALKKAFDEGKYDLKKSDQFKEVTKTNSDLKAAHAFEQKLQEISGMDLAHLSPRERTMLFYKIMNGGFDKWAGKQEAAKVAAMSPEQRNEWFEQHKDKPEFIKFVQGLETPDKAYNEMLAKHGISMDDINNLANSVLHSNMTAQDWVDYLMLNPEDKLHVAPTKTNQDKYTLNVQQGNDQVVQLKGPKEIREFFRALNFVKGLYNKDDFKTLSIDPETLSADIGDVDPEFKDLVAQYTPEDLEGRTSPSFIDVFMPRGGNADEERYARFMHAMSEGDPSYFFGDVLKDLPKEYANAKEKMLDAFISTGKLPDDIWEDKEEGKKYTEAYDRALRKYGSAREAFHMFADRLKSINDDIKSYPEDLQYKIKLDDTEKRNNAWQGIKTNFKDARDAMRELKGLIEPEKRTGIQRIIKALGLRERRAEFFEKHPDMLRQYASGKRKLQDWLAARISPEELSSMIKNHITSLPKERQHEAAEAIKPYLVDLLDKNSGIDKQDRIARFMENVTEDAQEGDNSPLAGFTDVFTDEMYKQAGIKNIVGLLERKDITDTLGLTDMEDALLNAVHNSQNPNMRKINGLASEVMEEQRQQKAEDKALKDFTDSANKKDTDEKNIYNRKMQRRRQEGERQEEKEKAREAKKYLEDAKLNEAKNAAEAKQQTKQRQEAADAEGGGWIPDRNDTGYEPGTPEYEEYSRNLEPSLPYGKREKSASEQVPFEKGTVLSPEMKNASDKFNSMSADERASELVKNKKIRHDTVIEAKAKGDVGGKLYTKKKPTDEEYTIDLSPIAKVLDDLGGF